jgi:aminoglycoside phosphotransferase (APT) family kinase protein
MPQVDVPAYPGDDRGSSADLIAWSEREVIKLFRSGFPVEAAECEFLNALAAANLGLPTPRPMRMVSVNGRVGIVFERCGGISLYDALVAGPDSADKLADSFFEFQQRIHTFPYSNFPRQVARLRERVRRAIGVSDVAKSRALLFLDESGSKPVLCHGDYHPLNVLMTPAGMVAIDWLDACQGDSAADMCRSLLLIEFARMREADKVMRAQFLHRYQIRCAQTIAMESLDAWRLPVAIARLAEPVDLQERQCLLQLIVGLTDAKV